VATLRDARPRPQIPTATVWLAAFTLFVLRVPSFHALEQDFRRPRRWARWLDGRLPSADTLGRGLAGLALPELRALLAVVHRRAWRRRTIHRRPGEPYRVVAVDGHELWASQARCCPQCLQRTVRVKDAHRVEYYHRVVVAQWVGVMPPAIVDIERIHPGEGEVVAARRLVARVLQTYGRLVDVITADALYLEAPFIESVLAAGKHVVIVLKQEARELYQDAERLRVLMAPQVIQAPPRTTRLWDLPELTSFPTLGRSVRVIWAEEHTITPRILGGQRQRVEEDRRWIWVTDLPASVVPATTIQQWGHARWDLETRGFGELTMHWHLDHCFIHDVVAMEALLLTLALAFLTTYLFYARQLKPEARRHLTRAALAVRLREDLSQLAGAGVSPAVQRSD
jgi:hypothetical protein